MAQQHQLFVLPSAQLESVPAQLHPQEEHLVPQPLQPRERGQQQLLEGGFWVSPESPSACDLCQAGVRGREAGAVEVVAARRSS